MLALQPDWCAVMTGGGRYERHQVCLFHVRGIPVTQGSKKLVTKGRGGRPLAKPRMIEDRAGKLDAWRESVATSARLAMRHTVNGRVVVKKPTGRPVVLIAFFHLPRPRRPKHPDLPVGKPDLSKLVRAIEDAMTKIVWGDDAQVVVYEIEKRYVEGAAPGVAIEVIELVPAGAGL